MTTGGAVCPDFVPEMNVKRLADGTLGSTNRDGEFDFVWGEPGAETMPPGSMVTFEIEATYASGTLVSGSNSVTFSGDPSSATGKWPIAFDSVSFTVPSSPTLGLTKTVSPTQPRPGQTVTFTVELINYSRLPIGVDEDDDIFFVDSIHPILQATNPAGFSDLVCRSLTGADGIFNEDEPVGEATCPEFTSTVAGIGAIIDEFPAYSGLLLTYTAVAPLDSASAPNIASFTNEELGLTSGDTAAQANLSVVAVNVSGTVWYDEDASAGGTFDNIQNGGETGTEAGGLTAVLVDELTGEVIAVVPVNADGTYNFTAVPAGIDVTATITATANAPVVGDPAPTPELPEGWTNTAPLTQATFNTGLRDTVDKDFGVVQPASGGDTVWLDTDRDGVLDAGEEGVAGVTVALYDADGNEVGRTTTDEIGNYLFEGLLPGGYQVEVIPPSGHEFTTADQGDDDAADSDVLSTGRTASFTLDADQDRRDIDAGLIVPPGTIGDRAWLDTNGDGIQDDGEPGFGGVVVTLYDADGNVVATTTTDSNGNYLFADLEPGQYTVEFVTPDGWTATTSISQLSTIGPNGIDLDRDAGFYQPPPVPTPTTAVVTPAARRRSPLPLRLRAAPLPSPPLLPPPRRKGSLR